MGRCLTGSMRQREGGLGGEPARQKTRSQEKVVTEGPRRTDLAPDPETRHISKSLLEQRMEEGREKGLRQSQGRRSEKSELRRSKYNRLHFQTQSCNHRVSPLGNLVKSHPESARVVYEVTRIPSTITSFWRSYSLF